DRRLRDLVLQSEDVAERPVVTLGPDVPPRDTIDQLRDDANPRANFANAADENVFDIELARDLDNLHRPSLEGESRIARDDEKRRDPRQVGEDIFGDAVAEVFLLDIAAHVDER